jgi:hypothetical protein
MSAAIGIAAAGLALSMLGDAAAAQTSVLSAREAIERSIASPGNALPESWIEMNVCGSGEDGARGFLNSKEDYRDRASLNIELHAPVRAALTARLNGDPIDVLYGERIRIYGAARQVRISVFRRSDDVTVRHYYQTQLSLASADRLQVIEREPDLADGAGCGLLAT